MECAAPRRFGLPAPAPGIPKRGIAPHSKRWDVDRVLGAAVGSRGVDAMMACELV